jgi:flagellar biosynthesis/type III secretory pathway chaperone
MQASDYLDRLISIAEKKVKELEKILQLTIVMQQSILESNDDQIEQCIESKDSVMAVVDDLDEQFSVYSERLKSVLSIQSLDELSKFDFPRRIELKAVVSKIMNLLIQIQETDTINNESLRKEMDETGNQIKQLQRSKKVNNAYLPTKTYMPSIYFDKKK